MGNRSAKQQSEEKAKQLVEEKIRSEETSDKKVEQDNSASSNEAKPSEECSCKDCTCNPCTCGKSSRCEKCNCESCNCKLEDITKNVEKLKVANTDDLVNDDLGHKLKEVEDSEVPSVQPESVVEIKAL